MVVDLVYPAAVYVAHVQSGRPLTHAQVQPVLAVQQYVAVICLKLFEIKFQFVI